MVLYSGQNCGDLTPVTCNDDLFTNGEPDWRAGIDVATEAGKQYYLMVDAFEFQGIVAKGEVCVEVPLPARRPKWARSTLPTTVSSATATT